VEKLSSPLEPKPITISLDGVVKNNNLLIDAIKSIIGKDISITIPDEIKKMLEQTMPVYNTIIVQKNSYPEQYPNTPYIIIEIDSTGVVKNVETHPNVLFGGGPASSVSTPDRVKIFFARKKNSTFSVSAPSNASPFATKGVKTKDINLPYPNYVYKFISSNINEIFEKMKVDQSDESKKEMINNIFDLYCTYVCDYICVVDNVKLICKSIQNERNMFNVYLHNKYLEFVNACVDVWSNILSLIINIAIASKPEYSQTLYGFVTRADLDKLYTEYRDAYALFVNVFGTSFGISSEPEISKDTSELNVKKYQERYDRYKKIEDKYRHEIANKLIIHHDVPYCRTDILLKTINKLEITQEEHKSNLIKQIETRKESEYVKRCIKQLVSGKGITGVEVEENPQFKIITEMPKEDITPVMGHAPTSAPPDPAHVVTPAPAHVVTPVMGHAHVVTPAPAHVVTPAPAVVAPAPTAPFGAPFVTGAPVGAPAPPDPAPFGSPAPTSTASTSALASVFDFTRYP
jgi:hypothetical protein